MCRSFATLKEQKQEINIESESHRRLELVAVNHKKDDGAELASADVIACARSIEKVLKTTNSAYIAGHRFSENRASTTRLCPALSGEIGISDKFCRCSIWRLPHLARRQIVPAVFVVIAMSMRSSLQHEPLSNEIRSEPASQSRRAVIVIPFGGGRT